MSNETVYPVKVVETFHIEGFWNDFVCVWKRVNIEDKEKSIIVHNDILNTVGILENEINNLGLKTHKKV
jgi:hypothetical protein